MRVLRPKLEPAPTGDAADDPHGQALRAHRWQARGAYAPETERKLRSGTAAFLAWCRAHGHAAFPAAPAILAGYIDAAQGRVRPATIASHVWAVSRQHLAAGLPDPSRDQAVRLALRRFRRAQGTAQRQAAPLGEREVAAILATTRGSDLHSRRDRALLLLARDTMCRRSELVGLQVADLERDPDGTATLLVRRSKTDQEGAGRVVYADRAATAALGIWLAAAGITRGPIFRAVRGRGLIGGPLDGNAVAVIFKKLARRAGLDPRRVSGHSTRVGTTQDLVADNVALAELMILGNWKSAAMPARYAARRLARRNAMAQYHARRRTA
jgi:integrase